MRLIKIRKVRIASHRANQSSEIGCVLSQILNVVTKPHTFDVVHICANGFKFTAEFDTALNHWRCIGELVQVTARHLYFELDELGKHGLIVSHYKGRS